MNIHIHWVKLIIKCKVESLIVAFKQFIDQVIQATWQLPVLDLHMRALKYVYEKNMFVCVCVSWVVRLLFYRALIISTWWRLSIRDYMRHPEERGHRTVYSDRYATYNTAIAYLTFVHSPNFVKHRHKILHFPCNVELTCLPIYSTPLYHITCTHVSRVSFDRITCKLDCTREPRELLERDVAFDFVTVVCATLQCTE